MKLNRPLKKELSRFIYTLWEKQQKKEQENETDKES